MQLPAARASFAALRESNYPLTGSPRIIYAPPETAGGVRYHAAFIKKNGDVAQLGERGVRNAEARGSIPLISTKTGKGDGRFVKRSARPLVHGSLPAAGPC